MTYFVAKVNSFFVGRKSESHDPVFTFFFSTKSRARKRVYMSALKKAQADQEQILKEAKEKVRV